MTATRRHLSDRRVRIGIWLIGVVLVWIGYRAQSAPVILVGALLATSGYWQTLTPAFRYRRRVTAAVGHWQQALGAARTRYVAARGQRRDRLAALPAPEPCARARERLLVLVMELGGSEPGSSVDERTRQGILDRERARQEVEALRAASGAEERAYGEQVAGLLSEFLAEYVQMTTEFERALSEAISRIEALAPPKRLGEQHRALAGSLREEYIGLSTYDQAVRERRLDPALAALERLRSARALTQAAIAEISAPA